MSIRELRESKHFDVKTLGEKAGVPRTTISKYENGHLEPKNMTLEMGCKILRATGHKRLADSITQYLIEDASPKENTGE